MNEESRLVIFSLPIGAPSRQAQIVTLASQDQGAEIPAQPVGRILIAEDDYFVAISIEEALVHAGFVITGIAETADEAVALAGRARPDIVLMDIHLRNGRDGIDAAREILQRFNIPSVFATAQDDPGTHQRGEQEAYPLGWILKPFSLRELVDVTSAAVARAIKRRGGVR